MTMREMKDLGVAHLESLPFVTRTPEVWQRLHDRLHATPFLRSEGLVVELGPPQRADAQLVAESRELTQRFARFYAHAVRAYFDRPELRPEFLFESLLAPLLEIDAAAHATTPLARLDCVLGTGPMRVIEINPIGGTLIHVRALFYLVRAMLRAGLTEAAAPLEALGDLIVDGFARYYKAHQPNAAARPTLGVLTPAGWRGTNLLFRGAFRRRGWEYVFGDARDLEADARGIRLKGVPLDMLWHDFLFIMAYQAARYRQTKWPTKVANYSDAPAQTEALLANPHFMEHLRTRRVVAASPTTAYLALPKSLLGWIHDPERPCPEADRAWLQDHVARTYNARDRERGVLTLEQALDERADLIIKPCLYGGSHGVAIGKDTAADAWAALVREHWSDPTWVLQRFCDPARISDGQVLSVGLYAFEGVLGGMYLRTAPSTIVSARTAAFLPVVL